MSRSVPGALGRSPSPTPPHRPLHPPSAERRGRSARGAGGAQAWASNPEGAGGGVRIMAREGEVRGVSTATDKVGGGALPHTPVLASNVLN